MSGRAMRDEIREAKTNRDAAIGMVVFTPAHAPTGIAPFDLRAGDVYAVIDPENPDPAILEAAVRSLASWPSPRSASATSRSTRWPSARR